MSDHGLDTEQPLRRREPPPVRLEHWLLIGALTALGMALALYLVEHTTSVAISRGAFGILSGAFAGFFAGSMCVFIVRSEARRNRREVRKHALDREEWERVGYARGYADGAAGCAPAPDGTVRRFPYQSPMKRQGRSEDRP